MNQLIIIGNGFDLAHGLKTSYNDFLIWYLQKIAEKVSKSIEYKDGCIHYKRWNMSALSGTNIKTLKDFQDFREYNSNAFKTRYIAPFFQNLIDASRRLYWVDIESSYYSEILTLYKKLEKANITRHENISSSLSELNRAFACLKMQLEEYLTTVEENATEAKPEITKVLNEIYGGGRAINKSLYFLVFNYTSTIENYLSLFGQSHVHVNYIHGKLNNKKNPMIFGYGDEMDSFYQKIESLNENAFLMNMKSYGYFKTDNYQNLFTFLNSAAFKVNVLGHSCGLSDRILFNSIFEHPKCQNIQLYYHQKSKDENDFFEKTQEISRHFKADKKGDMRTKIVSFEKSKPLVPVEQRL